MDAKTHSDPLEVLAAIIAPLGHLSQDHGKGARAALDGVRARMADLEEQLEAALRVVEAARKEYDNSQLVNDEAIELGDALNTYDAASSPASVPYGTAAQGFASTTVRRGKK